MPASFPASSRPSFFRGKGLPRYVKVSRDTDITLRTYLARQGMKKGDLSKFVEEAVRWRVLDRMVSDVKARNAGVSARTVQTAIDEALTAVRAGRLRAAGR